jgi:hypothetical protein
MSPGGARGRALGAALRAAAHARDGGARRGGVGVGHAGGGELRAHAGGAQQRRARHGRHGCAPNEGDLGGLTQGGGNAPVFKLPT